MSRENIELVRSVVDAHARGDTEAVFAAYDANIEWDVSRTTVPVSDIKPTYHGHEGVRSFWRLWLETWDRVSFEYHEFIDAGDHVVSILSQRMRGRSSGIEIEWQSYAQVWTVRDGKIERVEFFPTPDEALKATGPAE